MPAASPNSFDTSRPFFLTVPQGTDKRIITAGRQARWMRTPISRR